MKTQILVSVNADGLGDISIIADNYEEQEKAIFIYQQIAHVLDGIDALFERKLVTE